MSDLDFETEKTRTEVANYLREFADELEGGRAHRSPGDSSDDTVDIGNEGVEGGRDRVADDEPETTGESRTTGTPGIDETSEHPEAGGGTSSEDRVTLVVGNESATINPPERLRFAVSADTDDSLLEAGADRGVTFSLRWDAETVEESDDIAIE